MSDFALASTDLYQTDSMGVPPPGTVEALRDKLQIALAVADDARLRTLLANSTPNIAEPHQIGTVTANIGVPVEDSNTTVDGVVRYEFIHCVLAHHSPQRSVTLNGHGSPEPNFDHRTYAQITQFQSELKDLAQDIPLSQAIALLTHAGFESQQISAILQLPYQGWYKSWWYGLDHHGNFTRPFQRWFRSRHFADGTFTLQYRDFYAEEAPPCFKSEVRTIPVLIQAENLGFRDTLRLVNQARKAFQSEGAILICDRPSELELQGYLCQGVSVYGADEWLPPAVVNCACCVQQTCPLQGNPDSPVQQCRQFTP